MATLNARKLPIDPLYKIKTKQPTEPDQPPKCTFTSEKVEDTFQEYAKLELADEFKKSVCCTLEVGFDQKYTTWTLLYILKLIYSSAVNNKPAKYFEFPSGFSTRFQVERYAIPEVMFNPKYIRKAEVN